MTTAIPIHIEFARKFDEFYNKYRDFLVDDVWLFQRLRFRQLTLRWPFLSVKPRFRADYSLLIFLRTTLDNISSTELKQSYIVFHDLFVAQGHPRNEPLRLNADELERCRECSLILDAFCGVYLAEDRSSTIANIPGSAGLSTRVDELVRMFQEKKYSSIPTVAQEINRQATRLRWKLLISIIGASIVFGRDIRDNFTAFWNMLTQVLRLFFPRSGDLVFGYGLALILFWFLYSVPQRYFWGQFPPLIIPHEVTLPEDTGMLFWENRTRRRISEAIVRLRVFVRRIHMFLTDC